MIARYTPKDVGELWTDQTKFGTWLEVELAVLRAREQLSQIPSGTAQAITSRARFTVEEILERDRVIEHDLLAFVEVVRASLERDLNSYFHEGMTSFDAVDTAQAVLLMRAGKLIDGRLTVLQEALKQLAIGHADTLMIGRTHGVHGEPITFGFLVLNWYDQVRQTSRLVTEAFQAVAVGKCSGAMGAYTIDPEVERLVCQDLGLNQPVISTQITPRLLHANLLSAIAILGGVLEKIAQDIRLMQKTEVGEVEEPRKEGQKGSSAMPHKKNPVICERICGLARTLRGYAIVGLEDVATWDLRAIDQSSAERVALVDSIALIAYMLDKMSWVIQGLVVNRDRMKTNLELTCGVIYSQDVKLLLAERARERGVDITPDAIYEYVQQCAFQAVTEGKSFQIVLTDTLLPNGQPIITLAQVGEIDALMNPWRKLQYLPQVFERFGIQMEVSHGTDG